MDWTMCVVLFIFSPSYKNIMFDHWGQYRHCWESVFENIAHPTLKISSLWIRVVSRNPGSSQTAQRLRSTGCSSRGPRFNSQHPHGSSQVSVTPVPGDLIPSSGLHGHQAHTWCTYIHVDRTHICFILKNFKPHIHTIFTFNYFLWN